MDSNSSGKRRVLRFLGLMVIGLSLLLAEAEISGSHSSTSGPPGHCERYRGSVCKDYLANDSRVFFSGNKTMFQVEHELSTAFAEVLDQDDVLDNCADNAKALLCHWVYPTCGENNSTLPLCNDSVCEEIRTVSCSRDWATLETRITALGHLDFSSFSCDAERGSERPCTKVGFHDSCFVEDGWSYRGKVNITAEGHQCQNWALQVPQKHTDTPDRYPSLAGHNYCRNPGHTRAVPICHPATATVNTDWQETCGVPRCKNDPLYNPGQCIPINQTWYCSQYLDSKRQIFAEYVKFLEELNSDFALLATILTNPVIAATSICLEQFERFACHFFFPYCNNDPGFPVPVPVCQGDCQIVENVTCWVELSLARQWFDQVGFKRVYIPTCSNLPKLKTSLRTGDQGCFELGFSKTMTQTPFVYDCANAVDRGISYMGTVNISQSGVACLFWSDTYPRSHSFNPDQFPELRGNNYCRNPGGHDRFGPYCWISQRGRSVRDRCDIPDCHDTGNNNSSGSPEQGKTHFPVAIVLGTTIPCGLLIMLLVIVLSICLCRRRREDKDKFSAFSLAFLESQLSSEANPIYCALELESLGLPEGLNFPRENLTFIEDLGEGHFGKVFKAEAVNIGGIEETTVVAVKTLKETANEQSYIDFVKEVQVMLGFDHPNIVRLLGVCIAFGPPCMIFEFMSKGDLNQLLQSASPDMQAEEQKCKLSVSDLIAMVVQIASGMEYLAHNRYVHRDLATRNCLVDEDNTVKLADFGLARDVYSSDYYRIGGKAALPIRWMPPESIVYGRFSQTSDIWSFGIVLWEIFTFGKQPFYGMTNEAVIEFIVNKKGIPSPPSSCPFAVGNLMLQCWHNNPKKRPSFKEVHSVLLQTQSELIQTK